MMIAKAEASDSLLRGAWATLVQRQQYRCAVCESEGNLTSTSKIVRSVRDLFEMLLPLN